MSLYTWPSISEVLDANDVTIHPLHAWWYPSVKSVLSMHAMLALKRLKMGGGRPWMNWITLSWCDWCVLLGLPLNWPFKLQEKESGVAVFFWIYLCQWNRCCQNISRQPDLQKKSTNPPNWSLKHGVSMGGDNGSNPQRMLVTATNCEVKVPNLACKAWRWHYWVKFQLTKPKSRLVEPQL